MPTLLHPPLPAPSSRQRWHQLYGSARSLALAEAIESDTRPYLVIARDARELDQLRSELAFFLGNAKSIHVLPDWEVLPYDLFSPHPDIISERLAALAELPRLKSGVLLAAADTLGQTYRAARLCRWPHVQSRGGRQTADRATARAAGGVRLCLGVAGQRARRIRAARLAVRRVPDGRGDAAARGPVRRRDRGHPRVRSGNAALGRLAETRAPVAGPRAAARRRFGQGVPAALSQALRGRSRPRA